MTKFCGQISIPTVNNGAIACKNYYDTDCVIYQDPIAYFGTTEPSTSTEVFDFIIASLSDARSRVAILEGASTITLDLVPTDGSTNAVQSNGIFDALALKLEDAPIDGNQYVRINGGWAQIVGASNVLVGDNVAVATNPLPAYSSGTGNTSFGDRALENATTINGVVALGDMAGFYAAATETPTEGVTAELTINTDGIFIGSEAKPSANSTTNEVVIGAQAYGNGSNTVTLGDLRTSQTFLRGSVVIDAAGGAGGVLVPGPSVFQSQVSVTGDIVVTGVVDGRDVAIDGTKLDGIEAGATADQNADEVPVTDVGGNFTATDVEGVLAEIAASIAAGVSDGDKGDITVSGTGTVWSIDNGAVTFAKIQDVTTGIVVGRVTSGSGPAEELSGADVTTLLSLFSTTTTAQGLVPGSNGVGAGYYLDATGAWTAVAGGAGNTIYSADDALAGNRAVTLGAYQLTFTAAGGDVVVNNGRLGVNTPVYGGSRLGDSFLQTPSIDTTSINIKDGALNTALAIFSSPVGSVPGDGFVTTLKNFTDSVNVISVAAQDADQTSGTRQVESTLALRNDYQDNSYTVLDMFNQDYPAAGTVIAQKMGWVAIHGGGALAKNIGLWRYNGTTYTNIWELNASNVWTFALDINVPTEAYGVAWSGSTEVPTKGDLYTKLNGLANDFVDRTTSQTIGGIKTFNSAIHAGDGQIIFNDDPAPTGYASGGSFGYVGASQYYFHTDHAAGNSVYGALDVGSLTLNRTYVLPDKSGTIALLDDVGGGDLNSLTDVTITAPGTGDYIRYNGSNFVNYDPTGDWVPIAGNVTMTGALNVAQRLGITTGTNAFTSTASTLFTDASNRIGFKQTGVNSNVESMVFELANITAHRVVTWPDKTGTVAFLDDVSGATTLGGLTDVVLGTPATGEYLRFNGTNWVDSTIQVGDIPTLTAYVAVTGDSMSGALTMGANILADTAGTRDIGTHSTPFFESYSRRFIIKKTAAYRSWRFEGNDAGNDLTLNIETSANSNTWSGAYTFNASGAPSNASDVVDLAYLQANYLPLTGGSITSATNSTTKDTGALILTNGGLGVEGNINAGGDITAFASSDESLKDYMTRISYPLDKIALLTGYNFTWNNKQDLYHGDDIGLSAQEVSKVIPSAVREGSSGYLQVDYKKVIPLAVEAIKELKVENEEFQKQLQAQGSEIQTLKAQLQAVLQRLG